MLHRPFKHNCFAFVKVLLYPDHSNYTVKYDKSTCVHSHCARPEVLFSSVVSAERHVLCAANKKTLPVFCKLSLSTTVSTYDVVFTGCMQALADLIAVFSTWLLPSAGHNYYIWVVIARGKKVHAPRGSPSLINTYLEGARQVPRCTYLTEGRQRVYCRCDQVVFEGLCWRFVEIIPTVYSEQSWTFGIEMTQPEIEVHVHTVSSMKPLALFIL